VASDGRPYRDIERINEPVTPIGTREQTQGTDFNHTYATELTTRGQPAVSQNRRALVLSGDNAGAKAAVTRLLDLFGFDTVDGSAQERMADSAGHARVPPAPLRRETASRLGCCAPLRQYLKTEAGA
jgi:hypothetical protein